MQSSKKRIAEYQRQYIKDKNISVKKEKPDQDELRKKVLARKFRLSVNKKKGEHGTLQCKTPAKKYSKYLATSLLVSFVQASEFIAGFVFLIKVQFDVVVKS